MTFCLTTDLTGNGRQDVIVGATGAEWRPTLPVLGDVPLRQAPVTRQLIEAYETNAFWYENPGWKRHAIGKAPRLSVGGALGDLTGNGRQDLVTGQNLASDLYWFEQPGDPRNRWTRRLITDAFEKYHDVIVADVDDDGEDEVVAASQNSEVVFYYDVPDDPTQSPWPRDHRHVVADGLDVEGLAVVDLDGDGRSELVAGANVFRRTDDGWDRTSLGSGWEWTRVAIGDLDGDGDPEIVLSEGDRPYQDGERARLGVFSLPDWDETIISDDLSNPHTLQLADFDDDGVPELFVAEMGREAEDDPTFTPRQYLVRANGDGYETTELGLGVATHEAKVVDLTGDGRLDIVGKSYGPSTHVDVWHNES